MAIRMKRKKSSTVPAKQPNIVYAPDGTQLAQVWCRKCCKMKNVDNFFTATDTYLDASGKFSICKQCINDIYNKVYLSERDIDKTIYKLCKLLNVRYEEEAVRTTIEGLNKKLENDKEIVNVFGTYKTRLQHAVKKFVGDVPSTDNMTFNDVIPNFITDPIPDDHEDAVDLKQFWGSNYNYDDYIFLENELSEWKKTHKSDTKAEESLLKELCHKALEIRKARELDKPTATMVKEYQDLMKTANVDPAKTAIAGSGKAQDTWGGIIKMVEQTTPAEFYKDKELFKDYDNIEWYFKKFVTRPLSNFLGITRLFNLEDNADDGDDDFDETILNIVDKDKGE